MPQTGMTQQTPSKVLENVMHLRCFPHTCARLQGEAVDLLAVHPCGPAHARRKVEAKLCNQPRNAGVVQDARQRLPYALPGACAARVSQMEWRKHHAIYLLLLRCAMTKEIAFQLQKPGACDGSIAGQCPGAITAEHAVMCFMEQGLASTEREKPLGCALCIQGTALLKICSAVSCAFFGRRQLSMRDRPALLQWTL